MDADLRRRALEWIDQDPDPDTRDELQALLDVEAEAEVRERFTGRLQFGTAGLRGELGAGPQRMNRVVVAQAAAGLAAYLHQHEEHPSAVVGFDARHNSDVFARDTAEILAGAGVRAVLLPEPLPTPVLAFAIGHLGLSAGVMVTASHNPPRDNGYKVYLGDTSQIVPPLMPTSRQRSTGSDGSTSCPAPTTTSSPDPRSLTRTSPLRPRPRRPGHARSRRSTRPSTAWGCGRSNAPSRRPVSRPSSPCRSRLSPTRTSPPWRSPTPRNPGRWPWPWPWPPRSGPTS